MTDMIDRLSRLGEHPDTLAGDATVLGDLGRAHAAVSRRRRRRAAATGAGLTLALGSTLGVVLLSQDGGHPADSPPAASGTADPTSEVPGASSVELVAYDGRQPAGFVLEKVPEGYVLQGADRFVLALSLPDDTTHLHDYHGKLVVMLESQSAQAGEMSGDPVTVNGHPGALRDAVGARILEYHDGSHEVLVQAWETIGLTDEQLVEFAEGITVTDEARAGVG